MRKNSLKRIIISLIFIMLVSTTVAYASGSASVTSSLTVGQTGSIKLSAKAPGGFFQGSVSVSDSSIIKLNPKLNVGRYWWFRDRKPFTNHILHRLKARDS
jgi:hypothetical protein